jgi:hypothetical protein
MPREAPSRYHLDGGTGAGRASADRYGSDAQQQATLRDAPSFRPRTVPTLSGPCHAMGRPVRRNERERLTEAPPPRGAGFAGSLLSRCEEPRGGIRQRHVQRHLLVGRRAGNCSGTRVASLNHRTLAPQIDAVFPHPLRHCPPSVFDLIPCHRQPQSEFLSVLTERTTSALVPVAKQCPRVFQARPNGEGLSISGTDGAAAGRGLTTTRTSLTVREPNCLSRVYIRDRRPPSLSGC